MYKVIIKCDGATEVIMETDKMTSRDVYKSALADIKWLSHIETASIYDRYDAYVYKDGKLLYLLGLSDYRRLSAKWIGITRACDLKTCIIQDYSKKEG